MNEMDRVFFTYQENKEYVTLEDFLNYKANNISGTTIFMEIFNESYIEELKGK